MTSRSPLQLLTIVLAIALIAAACSSGGDAADTTETSSSADTTAVTETTPASDTTAAATETTPADPDRMVADGDSVTVHYVGTLDDGSQFDSSRDRDQPFVFTVGANQVIAGFESAVLGLRVGDTVTERMEAADAYGEYDESLVLDFPNDESAEGAEVGTRVQLSDGRIATIVAITDDVVTIDANHELAGEALTFEIEVLAIE